MIRHLQNQCRFAWALILLLTLMVSIGACTESDLGGLHASSDGIIFRYGNFCGKDWPVLHSSVPSERVAELQSIMPYDSLDAACKQHDICYATFGFSTPECDDVLLKQMMAMSFADPRCSEIARNIGAFAVSNPGQVGHGRLNLNSLLNVPLVSAENVLQVPVNVMGKVAGVVPMGEPICINGTGPYRGPHFMPTGNSAARPYKKKH